MIQSYKQHIKKLQNYKQEQCLTEIATSMCLLLNIEIKLYSI